MWLLSPNNAADPRPQQWDKIDTKLPIVPVITTIVQNSVNISTITMPYCSPDGTSNAASFPVISAAVACSRATDGQSPNTSSPTSASLMILLIVADGRVTVSDRQSTSRTSRWLPLDAGGALQCRNFSTWVSTHELRAYFTSRCRGDPYSISLVYG